MTFTAFACRCDFEGKTDGSLDTPPDPQQSFVQQNIEGAGEMGGINEHTRMRFLGIGGREEVDEVGAIRMEVRVPRPALTVLVR